MTTPLVAIFGCGPAGLLTAHACEMRDIPFQIFSRKVKSKLGGAQFSHIQIPGLHEEGWDEPVELTYEVYGDGTTYHNKVYGGEKVPFVSFDHVKDGLVVPAWPLVQMYDRLWDKYKDRVLDLEITPWLAYRFRDSPYDIVFSSVHAPMLCMGSVQPSVNHWFKSQRVSIKNEAINPNLNDNTIVYDGTKDHSWYRMSKIFGVGSTEWGAYGALPPLHDLRTVSKPLGTNCDCHLPKEWGYDTKFIRIGRFGTWEKGQLTSHAYNLVVDVLETTT